MRLGSNCRLVASLRNLPMSAEMIVDRLELRTHSDLPLPAALCHLTFEDDWCNAYEPRSGR